jgi:hypothetical protein
MRQMRHSLIAVAILTLPLGLASAVAAQSATRYPEPPGANRWTGAWIFDQKSFDPGTSSTAADGSGVVEGMTWQGHVDADDPRISGTMTIVQNARTATGGDADEGDLALASGAIRIDNDEGAWVGSLSAFSSALGGEEWYVLTGEGAYDLSTIFRWYQDGYEGVSLPGELPAMPEPIVAPAE